MQYPNIKVIVGELDISPVVVRFCFTSGLYDEMDSVSLTFRDIENTIASTLSVGNSIHIQWGYDGEENFLFEGVVTSINKVEENVTLKAMDYSVTLNSILISETYLDESASNILNTVLGNSSLNLEIEESDLIYSVFPIFNESVMQVVQKITKDVSKHSGVPHIFYTRSNLFNWKAMDISISPVMEFTTGENILEWIEGKSLTTLIVSVFCGDIISVNDKSYLVESASYRWDNGGRTMLGVSAI